MLMRECEAGWEDIRTTWIYAYKGKRHKGRKGRMGERAELISWVEVS